MFRINTRDATGLLAMPARLSTITFDLASPTLYARDGRSQALAERDVIVALDRARHAVSFVPCSRALDEKHVRQIATAKLERMEM